MKTLALRFFSLLAATSLLVTSCSRSEKSQSGNDNKARLQIALTDDPGDYQAVLIDVREIKINFTTNDDGWQTLPGIAAGQYDLLRLVNDEDTLLADVDLNPGRIQQIRLVLGPDNFVKVDNQLIRLETPSAQQSGLKLNIQHDVQAGLLYKLTMDFDVAKSIVHTGSGKYMLKPVIRTILEAAGGTIQGAVTPYSFPTAVLVFRGANDTVASTYSSILNGGYRVRGLDAGTYSLHFLPTDGLHRDTVLSNVVVNNAMVTVVDTMRLGQ